MRSVEEISEIAAAADKELVEQEVQRALKLIDKAATNGKFSAWFVPETTWNRRAISKALRGLGYNAIIDNGSEYGGKSGIWIGIPKPKPPKAKLDTNRIYTLLTAAMAAVVLIVYVYLAIWGQK